MTLRTDLLASAVLGPGTADAEVAVVPPGERWLIKGVVLANTDTGATRALLYALPSSGPVIGLLGHKDIPPGDWVDYPAFSVAPEGASIHAARTNSGGVLVASMHGSRFVVP